MSTTAPRSRTITWQDPARLAAAAAEMSGLEFFERLAAGALPPPPIVELMGFELVSAERGRCVFAFRPAEWMFNPIGSVHGGVAATVLDSCMGCAVHTTLPAGTGYTTTDLQIRYLRPTSIETGRVLSEGTVVHAGRRQATAEGRMYAEESGKLIATATTGCILL